MREKIEKQKEAERVERRRQEKLEELELQRKQIALKMDEVGTAAFTVAALTMSRRGRGWRN